MRRDSTRSGKTDEARKGGHEPTAVTERERQSLIRDLRRLQSELPELIAAVQSGNDEKAREAIALVTRGSSGRAQLLMDRLTDSVLVACGEGDYRPLRAVASGFKNVYLHGRSKACVNKDEESRVGQVFEVDGETFRVDEVRPSPEFKELTISSAAAEEPTSVEDE